MVLALLLLLLLLPAVAGWWTYDDRRRYGPLTPGSLAWKFHAPERAAAAERLELLAALTPSDREWLRRMGWDESRTR